MADLMNAASEFTVLETQYGNFQVPAMKLLVNGSDLITAKQLVPVSAQITLSLRAAGMAVVKLAGLYNISTHSFDEDMKVLLMPGTIVELEVGYLSTTQKVFKGYVAMLGAEFGDDALFVVTLLDARRLMMTSGRRQLLHSVTNYSDAVKTILMDYSLLCSAEVDATNDQLVNPVSQTTNDYDFIVKELIGSGKTDREFFIVADKAYFRTPQSVKTPMMTVSFGRELISLKVDFAYLDLNVEVIGYDPKEQQAVKASAAAKGFQTQLILQGTTPTLYAPDADADSQAKAASRAQALARKSEEKRCMGTGISIGLPELVPGRFLQVSDLDAMVNHKYYLTEVTHVLNENGFITSFEIGGVE